MNLRTAADQRLGNPRQCLNLIANMIDHPHLLLAPLAKSDMCSITDNVTALSSSSHHPSGLMQPDPFNAYADTSAIFMTPNSAYYRSKSNYN